ncbi:MAG: hypothetical protein V3U78_06435 [Thiotrichaceae bacterium]
MKRTTTLLTYISLFTGCLLVISNSYATPQSNSVKVSLQQAIDKNCNGNTENRQLAIPGACIVYTITATNLSDAPVFNIRLSGKIPKYTKLYKKPLSKLYKQPNINNDNSLEETILTSNPATGEPLIQSLFSRLEPGHAHSITMQYTVRIL